MMLSDGISDMLTRIRNAQMRRKQSVDVLSSKINIAIAEVLKREGFIRKFERLPAKPQEVLRITLKYTADGEPLIKKIKRESKPGRRLYKKVSEMPKVLSGLGIGIYSTSKGVMSDRECRTKRIGGEYLASVW
ncbi:MAG: 30S ribosomal protein S8 [Planctomycetota bacterium]|nr:30S ribosomal protein S8 [Planctomycetota bacterium]